MDILVDPLIDHGSKSKQVAKPAEVFTDSEAEN